MSLISFNDFLGILAPRAAQHRLQQPYGSEHGIREPVNREQFVAPKLKEISPVTRGQTSVMLVSAPGAVGKTMLAERIAFEKQTPLWDLGAVQVGHDFATGTVAGAFGDDLFTAVMAELRDGRRIVVFDALDEARLRAGEANFEGFLDGVADRFRQPRERPALVLLGREEVVDWAELWLQDKGVLTARYDIEYFDLEAAKEFIEKYLAALPNNRIRATDKIRQSPVFAEACSAVLKRLGDCAPEAPQRVVGYAPVLIVVSEYLNEGNPHGLLQKIEQWKQQDPARLLAQVARELLEREHLQKSQEPLRSVFGASAGFKEWNKLYTPDEQCLRLLASECHYTLGERPPRDLPRPMRNDYEKAIGPWLEDHPFRGQTVFREYTYAWLLGREDLEPGLRESIRGWLTSPDTKYLPSRLLAEFLSAMGGTASSSAATVEAADFGLVYESVVAGAAKGDIVRLSLASEAGDELVSGEIAWFNEQPGKQAAGKPKRKLELSLRRPQQGVWFWRQLAHADIQIAASVKCGSTGSDFVLGPDVDVECDTFACAARALRVLAGTENQAVMITARAYNGESVPTIVGEHANREHFGVAWEPTSFPWAPHRVTPQEPVETTPAVREAFQKLRRILVRFRAEGFGHIGRSAQLMENSAVAGRGMARELLNYCVEMKLISKTQGWYQLERQAMNDLGINWPDVTRRKLSSAVAVFLRDFLNRPQ